MRNLLFLVLVPWIVSCGPTTPTEPGHPTNPIRAAALVETYRDFPERAKQLYTSQVVVVRVTRGHYTVVGRELRWFATGNRERGPSFVMECRHNPASLVPEANLDLLVTGKCVGRFWDGVDHGNDVKFVVHMTDCVLTAVGDP